MAHHERSRLNFDGWTDLQVRALELQERDGVCLSDLVRAALVARGAPVAPPRGTRPRRRVVVGQETVRVDMPADEMRALAAHVGSAHLVRQWAADAVADHLGIPRHAFGRRPRPQVEARVPPPVLRQIPERDWEEDGYVPYSRRAAEDRWAEISLRHEQATRRQQR